MKRGIVVLVLIVAVGAMAAGWWWARTSPEEATQFLVAGGLEEARAQSFVAALGGQEREAGEEPLVASGSIEGETVVVVSEFGGRIEELSVGEGDEVRADQVVVRLDSSLFEAQVAQAEAGVEAARANLEKVRAGTHPAEILAAEAALHQALAERDAAKRAWEDMQALLADPQDVQAQIVQAQADVELAEAQIEQAEAKLAEAEADREPYKSQGSVQEKYLYVMYDYQVQAAQAQLEAARANKKGAQARVAALRAVKENPLAVVSQVHAAEGRYDMAVEGVRVALAKLDELKAGPRPEELAVAEAQVEQAQAAVSALQAQIEKMTLRSPIDGLVTSRSARAGETVLAGSTILSIANLDEVKLTIYVPEDELGRVYLGQPVEVRVDSFPERVFTGTVSHIAQQAEFTPKNIQTEKERVNMVFAVRVRLPNPEHLLKPGMPADAYLDGE